MCLRDSRTLAAESMAASFHFNVVLYPRRSQRGERDCMLRAVGSDFCRGAISCHVQSGLGVLRVLTVLLSSPFGFSTCRSSVVVLSPVHFAGPLWCLIPRRSSSCVGARVAVFTGIAQQEASRRDVLCTPGARATGSSTGSGGRNTRAEMALCPFRESQRIRLREG